MTIPSSWPFRPSDISTAAPKEKSMSQVDSRKAGKPYKSKAPGRKDKTGTEAVVKLETLRVRVHDLIGLKIAADQSSAAYNDAVKAVAETTGLLSVTVNKYVRARAGDHFLEDKAKSQQLTLCFEEIGELDDDGPKHPGELFNAPSADGNGRDHGADDDNDEGDEDDEAGAHAEPKGRRGRRAVPAVE